METKKIKVFVKKFDDGKYGFSTKIKDNKYAFVHFLKEFDSDKIPKSTFHMVVNKNYINASKDDKGRVHFWVSNVEAFETVNAVNFDDYFDDETEE